MKRLTVFSVFITFTLLVSACSSNAVATPLPQGIKNAVGAHFQAYYESKGGLKTFGAPLSPEDLDDNGIPYQVFENMRLEYMGGQVRPRKLAISNYNEPCIRPENVKPNAYYLQDCHSIEVAVQPYFNQLGGVEFWGNPISELHIENGRFIQYFERGAITWDSQKSGFDKSALAPLGRIGYVPSGKPAFTPVQLSVQSKVAYPLLAKNQQQTITTTVTDAAGKPVVGANLNYEINLPGNGAVTYIAPATNAQGISILTLPVIALKSPDIIHYTVTANYDTGSVTAQGEFMPWLGKP